MFITKNENEVTYYSTDENLILSNITIDFLNHIDYDLEKIKDLKYSDRLYFLFDNNSLNIKDKLIIKLKDSFLYYKLSQKNPIIDASNVMSYEERTSSDWISIDKLDLEHVNRPVVSLYYKDKCQVNIKYMGTKYKITGDDVYFLSSDNCRTQRKLKYVEIESESNNFASSFLTKMDDYFVSHKKFERLISYENNKSTMGSEVIGNNFRCFNDMKEFKKFIYEIYENLYCEFVT